MTRSIFLRSPSISHFLTLALWSQALFSMRRLRPSEIWMIRLYSDHSEKSQWWWSFQAQGRLQTFLLTSCPLHHRPAKDKSTQIPERTAGTIWADGLHPAGDLHMGIQFLGAQPWHHILPRWSLSICLRASQLSTRTKLAAVNRLAWFFDGACC